MNSVQDHWKGVCVCVLIKRHARVVLGAAAGSVGVCIQDAVSGLQRVELMCSMLVLSLVLLCVGNCDADVTQGWIQFHTLLTVEVKMSCSVCVLLCGST